ncbi:hypothetical protein H5410_028006 [Solanum commersonii]|uniref:Uncharacterized protein n=1 Tax=Solanum commersonii TaxID=4109 RepID=A0A9J5Z1F5_SOLCO|nr:hypothetical protein H5410_028006 [Solanum commersonii]
MFNEFKSAGEPIRGSPRLSVKGDRKKKSWYCGSSSSSFDGGDRETISAMESKIAYLNAELVSQRKERRKREEERGGDCGKERRNILPPCPASNDESDQEGDENDKSDKESEGDEE